MKKQAAMSLSLLAMVALTACGDDETTKKQSTKDDQETTAIDNNTNSNDTDEQVAVHTPTEPDHDQVCAFCNMKIFGSSDPLGAFTAQAITADGERVFFDDSGCLLNAERQEEQKFAQSWVRDLNTMDWTSDEDVTIVKADIQTPMKYGYAFFSDSEAAEQYVNDNANLNAAMTDWDAVDAVAYERYKKKMEKMNQGQHNNSDSESESEHGQSDSSHS